MENKPVTISIIVPVYNVEMFLPECLESLIGQTYRDSEIICVDDGSTDGSAAVLAKYAQQDSRIRVIRQANKRQGAARNAGLDIAAGKYVMFVDADDVLAQSALETFLIAAEQSASSVVVNRRMDVLSGNVNQSGIKQGKYKLERRGLSAFVRDRKIFSSVFNKLYCKSILDGLRFAEGVVFEDWPFLVMVFSRVEEYALIEAPLYFYRKEGPSTIRSAFDLFKVESYLKGIHMLADLYGKTPHYPAVRSRLAVAVKMMVGSAVRRGTVDARRRTLEGIRELFALKVLSPWHLNLKTRYRIWKLRQGKGV